MNNSQGSNETDNSPSENNSLVRRGTGFWRVIQSVAAALIGVQSSKNRERDFTHGKASHFIVGGVVGTLLFMIAVWLLVQYVLATS